MGLGGTPTTNQIQWMTQGWTGITAVNQLIYLSSDLLKNLVQGACVDKQVKTTHIIPIWEFFWEQMWVGWKMSTQLEGVLRGKETVKYSM
jgi:hypothetical protein